MVCRQAQQMKETTYRYNISVRHLTLVMLLRLEVSFHLILQLESAIQT